MILLVLIATYLLSNMKDPRNFTLKFSYAEIKPEGMVINSIISSLIINSKSEGEVTSNNNNIKNHHLFIQKT